MEVHNINSFSSVNKQEQVKDILNHYRNVTVGLGKLKNFELKLNINKYVRQIT